MGLELFRPTGTIRLTRPGRSAVRLVGRAVSLTTLTYVTLGLYPLLRGAPQAAVFVDRCEVGHLGRGGLCEVQVAPGRHVVHVVAVPRFNLLLRRSGLARQRQRSPDYDMGRLLAEAPSGSPSWRYVLDVPRGELVDVAVRPALSIKGFVAACVPRSEAGPVVVARTAPSPVAGSAPPQETPVDSMPPPPASGGDLEMGDSYTRIAKEVRVQKPKGLVWSQGYTIRLGRGLQVHDTTAHEVSVSAVITLLSASAGRSHSITVDRSLTTETEDRTDITIPAEEEGVWDLRWTELWRRAVARNLPGDMPPVNFSVRELMTVEANHVGGSASRLEVVESAR